MRFDIATLFPEMCQAVLEESIVGRGQRKGCFSVHYHNIRDYTADKHRRVDDYPYGGGMGMVMQPEPIYACYQAICDQAGTKPHVIYLSPQGKLLTEEKCHSLASLPHIMLLCGHYEGIDERVIEEIVDEELSIGDYVLTGGELGAMVVVDSVSRLLPGVLASSECFEEESLSDRLLEYPQYTRPPVWRGREVPPVLLSGHHANIVKWRGEERLRRTKSKRPDLLEDAQAEKNPYLDKK